MGEHSDLDGDGIADRGGVIDPALLDAQSRAFRENDAHVPDDELGQHAEVVHAGLGMGRDAAPIRLPEAFDDDGWDGGRLGPKTPAEAQQALAERIADPSAPDGDEVRAVDYTAAGDQ